MDGDVPSCFAIWVESALGGSRLPFPFQVEVWRGVRTSSCIPLIIYREQMISLSSWIWIKGYVENFRKELCSLEVCFVRCQPLSLSKTLLEAGFKVLIFPL